jgi:hypothetical protein
MIADRLGVRRSGGRSNGGLQQSRNPAWAIRERVLFTGPARQEPIITHISTSHGKASKSQLYPSHKF